MFAAVSARRFRTPFPHAGLATGDRLVVGVIVPLDGGHQEDRHAGGGAGAALDGRRQHPLHGGDLSFSYIKSDRKNVKVHLYLSWPSKYTFMGVTILYIKSDRILQGTFVPFVAF